MGRGTERQRWGIKREGTKQPQLPVHIQDERRDIQQLWIRVFSLLDNEKPGAKRGGAAETGNGEEQEELAR